MASVESAVIVKYLFKEKTFEILVDPDGALEFRRGAQTDLSEILAVRDVFKDARAGDRVSSADLKAAFATDDVLKCAEIILRKGEFHLTSDQKRKMAEDKYRQIIAIIARNAINPQTDLPHPVTRIEAAMKEARVRIDPFKSADEQVPDVVKALRPIIPIRLEKKQVAIKFPPNHAQRAVGFVKRIAEIRKDEWLPDGSWAALVEVPAGTVPDLMDAVNRETRGEAQISVVGSVAQSGEQITVKKKGETKKWENSV